MKSRVRALGCLLVGMSLGAVGCSDSGSSHYGSAAAAVTTSSTTPAATPPVPVASAPSNLATGPSMGLDPAAGFFGWPFPSDARVLANGSPDLSGLPNPRGEDFVDRNYRLAEDGPTGFSPTGVISIPFDGPINPPLDNPTASVLVDSPILLVDVDPASANRLERHPFHTQFVDTADSFRPANLLQVLPVPGRGLRVNTTYAVIVMRRLGAPGAQYLGQSAGVTALLAGQSPGGTQGAALAQASAALPAALLDLGIHPQDVAAATVFTTGDPTASLIQQVAWAKAQPAHLPSAPLVQRGVYADYTAIKSSYAAPQYQTGFAPFLWVGGEILEDAQGNPMLQGSTESAFEISVPKGTMPAAGFPLYLYCHGTGGLESQAIDRGYRASTSAQPIPGSGLASLVAPRGYGTGCAAGLFSPSRLGIMAADGYLAYNFLHPIAMRDNFKQMVLEQVHFLNLLLALRIDPALCPGTDASASPDGKVRFDPDTVVIGGQSLGSYLSGMVSSTLGGFEGVVLTGAGGSWVEFAFGPTDPVDLQMIVELLALPFGEKLDRFHPIVMAFDIGVGEADNTHYLRNLVREPLPGHTPPHVLVVEGHDDHQVPTNLQRALTLAVGLDLAGTDPGPTPDTQLLPVLPWGGLANLPYPVQGNRTLPGGAQRTVVTVRYPEDGIFDGHYIIFQVDEAKRQLGEFVEDVAAGRVPEVR